MKSDLRVMAEIVVEFVLALCVWGFFIAVAGMAVAYAASHVQVVIK